jgi:hypothetical protein
MPSAPPSHLGSRPKVCHVADAVWKSRPERRRGFPWARGGSVWGRVNTQWKDGTGNRSRRRASTQRIFASVWHVGPWRLWHE